MSEAFGRATKYVLTRGSQPPEWHNSRRLRGIKDVARIEAESGWSAGSANMTFPRMSA